MRRSTFAALALIALAAARIASTYTTLSATADEPMHLSAGLMLFSQHQYGYQLENPPMPRAVMAFAPWRAGVEFDPSLDYVEQLRRVFYSHGRYTRNLAIARAGNLVFFLLAAIATWLWARRALGQWGGVVATLIFTMQPVVLGYSGLVTHDAAATAGVALALLAFVYWLERPGLARAMLFGAAYGFSIACKFSCIAYVPAACAAMYAVRLIWDAEARRAWRQALMAIPIAATTCALVVIASYAGAIGLFFTGIEHLLDTNRAGMQSYLFGKVSETGWWWYFPAAVALKTTIASLLLVVLGFVARRERVFAESLAAALAILAVAMPSHLDLGVRYVLPMYVPLTLAAAAAAMAMLRSPRTWMRAAAVALLAGHAGASLLARRDTMAYFNVFAGPDPSRYLIDSNLEWGQDVLRLAKVVRARNIDRIGLSVHGLHDFDALGFPPHYTVAPWENAHGWIAVGDHTYRIWRVRGEWRSLRGQKYERIGRSIRLYHLKGAGGTPALP